jgi:hypothetical protein
LCCDSIQSIRIRLWLRGSHSATAPNGGVMISKGKPSDVPPLGFPITGKIATWRGEPVEAAEQWLTARKLKVAAIQTSNEQFMREWNLRPIDDWN